MNHIDKIKEDLKKLKLHSFFVTNQTNVQYLTGFKGLSPNEREAFLLITQKDNFLFTFPTYFGLYTGKNKNYIALNITPTKHLTDHLKEIIIKNHLKNIAIEKNNLTLTEYDSLSQKLKIPLKKTFGIIELYRSIKNTTEIISIKKAAKVSDLALEFIKNKISQNVTERYLALELEYFIKKNAGDIAFSPIVAFNEGSAIPHYLPSDSNKLKPQSIILIDLGAKFDGYCADITRIFFYGPPSRQMTKIYQTVLKAQEMALALIKPGLTGHSIDKIARDYINLQGFPAYIHGLGHGVGLDIHEDPRLKQNDNNVLQENMIVTVEPGIYLEGQYGVRIEDLLLLKNEGPEILSKSTKEITII